MSNFNLNHKEQKGYLILLLLVSPFLALFNILKLKNEKEITFFGTLFFGLIGSVYVYTEGNDGQTHRSQIINNYLEMTLTEFLKNSYDILTFNSTQVTDIYSHSLFYISGSIFQMPVLLHFFAGLVLGYFFTKSVLLVLNSNLRVKKNYIILGFIFLFLLIRSISALNSIRMWTGMWVFFYGTYGWSITKERKYLYFILFSMFVHFSYAVILIPAIVAYAIRNFKWLLVIIYGVSFFTSIGFSSIASYIPKADLFETKQQQYAIDSEDKAKRFEVNKKISNEIIKNKSLYAGKGQSIYLDYSIVGLTIILLFFYLKRTSNINFEFLISTGTGLYAFSNFMAFSPALQGRTKMIAATFLLAAAIQLQFTLKSYNLSSKTKHKLDMGFVVFLVSSIPMVLFQISYIISCFSFFLLLFPQISWVIGDNDLSIRDAIGFIID
ncbi:hypothetical protein [Flavobacterium sp.]|uniref:hypothetical protein n=1 Tax=Flavobacterium sp. TaxID=239 RepID=UPI003F69848B